MELSLISCIGWNGCKSRMLKSFILLATLFCRYSFIKWLSCLFWDVAILYENITGSVKKSLNKLITTLRSAA